MRHGTSLSTFRIKEQETQRLEMIFLPKYELFARHIPVPCHLSQLTHMHAHPHLNTCPIRFMTFGWLAVIHLSYPLFKNYVSFVLCSCCALPPTPPRISTVPRAETPWAHANVATLRSNSLLLREGALTSNRVFWHKKWDCILLRRDTPGRSYHAALSMKMRRCGGSPRRPLKAA